MPPYFFKVSKDAADRISEELDPSVVKRYEEVRDHADWMRGATENPQPDNGIIYTVDDLANIAVDAALGDGVLMSVELPNRDHLANLALRVDTQINPVN